MHRPSHRTASQSTRVVASTSTSTSPPPRPQTSSSTITSTSTSASASAAVAVTAVAQLGITQEDLLALRQYQQRAQQNVVQHSRSSSTAASTSRATTTNSSGNTQHNNDRLLLDPSSLNSLGRYFDTVNRAIVQRLEQLYAATERATQAQGSVAAASIAAADAAIAQLHELLRQIDDLENEFAKIRRMQEIVRGFRARVEELERRFA